MTADAHTGWERATAILELTIPDECVPGIAANLDLLKSHAHVLDAYLDHEDKAS